LKQRGADFGPSGRFINNKAISLIDAQSTMSGKSAQIDALGALLTLFPLTAQPLRPLDLSGGPLMQEADLGGRLQLLLRGALQIEGHGPDSEALPREQWLQPVLIWLPRPARHRLSPMSDQPLQLLEACVDFGSAALNPVLTALPPRLTLARRELPSDMAATLALLSEETRDEGCLAALRQSRLIEVLLLQWLQQRLLLARKQHGTLLAGLGDPVLHPVLDAMHRQPEEPWTLARLARLAGLSRTMLAERFATVVGQPPGDYLLDWRLRRARLLLRQGQTVAKVATAVGYGSAAALTHVFSQRLGISPARWRRQDTSSHSAS
jgi:AraC-like DNA-binding protein